MVSPRSLGVNADSCGLGALCARRAGYLSTHAVFCTFLPFVRLGAASLLVLAPWVTEMEAAHKDLLAE